MLLAIASLFTRSRRRLRHAQPRRNAVNWPSRVQVASGKQEARKQSLPGGSTSEPPLEEA